jgi:hypothetical protein
MSDEERDDEHDKTAQDVETEDDQFWDTVDTVFAEAADRGVSAIVLISSALNAACFCSHSMRATREDFLSMAIQAWDNSLEQVQYLRAEQTAAEGKAAKA